MTIRELRPDDIQSWVDAQTDTRGTDEVRRLSALWHDMQDGKRLILAAWRDDECLGHISLLWQSQYPPFRRQNIPEIVDLWVQPESRGSGIGSELLRAVELRAAEYEATQIGLAVGGIADFTAAHALYTTRGYAPDGAGVFRQEQHDVTMWVKDLAENS